MRTIKVTEKMYNALIGISKELNTQSHRRTRMPYMIQVRKKVEVAAYEGCGDIYWFDKDGSRLESEDDETRIIREHLFDKHGNGYEAIFDELDDYDRESILRDLGFREVEVTESDELTNFFFTEKGLRGFYGDDVDTFLTGVDNPELETVMRFLCELGGGELHK